MYMHATTSFIFTLKLPHLGNIVYQHRVFLPLSCWSFAFLSALTVCQSIAIVYPLRWSQVSVKMWAQHTQKFSHLLLNWEDHMFLQDRFIQLICFIFFSHGCCSVTDKILFLTCLGHGSLFIWRNVPVFFAKCCSLAYSSHGQTIVTLPLMSGRLWKSFSL